MEESEKNLVLASAVLCLSPTTEVARNRVVDSIVMQTATIMGLEEGLSSSGIYETLRKELPLRYEEIVSSIGRNVERGSLEVVSGGESGMESAVVKLSGGFHSELSSESERISDFLEEATKELFEDVYEIIGPEKIGNCLLDCVSRIMARYGYAYAGQVAGIMEASEFVPKKALKEVCEKVIKEHKISEISVERMMEGIGVLFDRRDPCLNNLAFCICQRYYSTRLLGMDIPLDFFSGQVYKDATMY